MEIINKLKFINITLEPNERKLHNGTISVTLSRKETSLMEYFFRNAKQTLTRDQLLVRVWGSDSFAEESSLDNYVSFLRKRLRLVESMAIIKTIHGIGYRLQENGVD